MSPLLAFCKNAGGIIHTYHLASLRSLSDVLIKKMIEELRKNLKEKRKQTQARFNFCRDTFEKRKASMARFNSARENFEKKEKKMRADLREASKTLAELSKKFKWWQSLP